MRENSFLNTTRKNETSVKNILIVEDEYVSRLLLCKLLGSSFNVETAETSEECFVKLSEKDFSLIFMDINLGSGLSGLDTIKILKKENKYKKIPIIATTAFALPGDKEEFIEAGCTNYLSKPFNKEILFNVIEELNI